MRQESADVDDSILPEEQGQGKGEERREIRRRQVVPTTFSVLKYSHRALGHLRAGRFVCHYFAVINLQPKSFGSPTISASHFLSPQIFSPLFPISFPALPFPPRSFLLSGLLSLFSSSLS